MSQASDRAYSHIRSMILSGELPAGAQVVEEALAEKCGVSRTPVREALRRLESDLLVVLLLIGDAAPHGGDIGLAY